MSWLLSDVSDAVGVRRHCYQEVLTPTVPAVPAVAELHAVVAFHAHVLLLPVVLLLCDPLATSLWHMLVLSLSHHCAVGVRLIR